MNRVEELIRQLCPNGVEWKKLGEVCEIKGRIGFRGYTQKDLVKEEEGAITLSPSNIINECLDFRNCSYISWFKYNESPEIQAEIGDVLFTKTASVGKCALIKYLPKSATINPQLVLLKKITCNAAYLTYVLLGNNFQDEVKKVTGIGSVPNIPQSSLSQIRIPIPPLSIQQEIVRILDTFTELTANLQTELEARKKQYAYYRDCLLNFEGVDGVEWKKLGEIGDVCMCKRIFAEQTSKEGDIPFYKIGTFGGVADTFIPYDLYEEYRNKYSFPKPGDILISAAGTIGKIIQYDGTDAYFQDSNIVWIDNDENLVLNRFLFYLYKIIKWQTDGGIIKRLYNDNIKRTLIPIPPLPEQRRIVAILDNFETLVNDLTVGLPAELRVRRKQYEYYRDKLLTFDRV